MADEIPEDDFERNLFGEVVYSTKGKRGRPPFQRTEENANKVSMLLAAGWSNERIARVVIDPRTGNAISVPTLKRYFRAEMKDRDAARDRLEARRLMRIWDQAEQGNVGAERLFTQLIDRNDRMEAERAVAGRKQADRSEKLGKKEVSAKQAVDADAQLTAELDQEATGRVRH